MQMRSSREFLIQRTLSIVRIISEGDQIASHTKEEVALENENLFSSREAWNRTRENYSQQAFSDTKDKRFTKFHHIRKTQQI